MKIIKISTELELTVHEFPTGDYSKQNEAIRKLIGEDCRIYEHVRPIRLYTELHQMDSPTKIPGQCVCMLVDEEGLLKKYPIVNLIGSYLYKSEKHGNPIVGNILFVGEEWSVDGIDFCGIEDSVFEQLELELNNLIFTIKTTKEALSK